MNLRTKTFFIITGVFIVAFIMLAMLLSNFIMSGYNREEVQSTRDKVLQAQSVLDDNLSNLDNTVTDWAEWDDTYQYIRDKNTEYVKSNLGDSTFFNNRLNLIAYLDTSGNAVYVKAYDLINGEPTTIPDGLEAYLKPDSPLLSNPDTNNGLKGIISLPASPMMVVSHPILTSQGGGPTRGTLIFGRYLDSVELGRISRVTHLSLKAYQPNDTQMSADFKSILPELLQGNSIVIQPLNDNISSGYTLLKDINGQPALILRIDNPRSQYEQSRNNVFYFTLALLAFGLLFIMLTLLILEKLVISRISSLSNGVNAIGQKGDLSSRISLPGKDEVSRLATNINGMLENLEQSRKLQRESETFNSALLQDSPNPIEVINPDGSIRFVNPALERITGYSKAQLMGRKPPYPWWFNENNQQYYSELQESISGRIQKRERHFHKEHGESFWVDITSTTIKENGKLAFLIANWVDITERKRAESALRESEKRFRELAELLPELVFEIDLQGKITFVNRIAFSVFGHPIQDYSGLYLIDFVAPEDMELIKQNCHRIILGEDSRDIEYTAIRKDGRKFPSLVHMTPVKNNQGEIIGLRGILVDITKQKEIEAELRASEEFSTSLLNNAPNPIIVTNFDTSVRYVNPAFERLSGYSSTELIGKKNPYPWWPKEKIQHYNNEIVASSDEGIRGSERYYQNKDGEIFWVSLTINPIKEDGKLKYYLGNWVDITERKRVEDALKESEGFSSSLRDNSPYPIMVINLDTSIRYVNPALEKISGFSAKDLIGQNPPYPYWTRGQETQQMDKFSRALQSSQKIESLFQRKTGDSFWVETNSTPIMEGDSIKYILSIWVDITAQKLASEELEKLYQREKSLREDLQAEIRSRTEFTRALVHELKTPLTPIMASSELLVEELNEEPLVSLARNVYRGAENMNRRVNELLDLARGEVGMLKVNLNPVYPETLLREVVKYMEPVVKNSGQSLSIDLPDNLPVIMADEDRLRQILFNLINNSIKYSSAGGNIKISAREEGNNLIIEVQDTGRGMSEEEQKKLFQPYYRIEGREHLSGLGLGLTLAKRFLELQNGRIWVKSQKGVGSTFFFSLPIKADDQVYKIE